MPGLPPVTVEIEIIAVVALAGLPPWPATGPATGDGPTCTPTGRES